MGREVPVTHPAPFPCPRYSWGLATENNGRIGRHIDYGPEKEIIWWLLDVGYSMLSTIDYHNSMVNDRRSMVVGTGLWPRARVVSATGTGGRGGGKGWGDGVAGKGRGLDMACVRLNGGARNVHSAKQCIT